MIDDSSIQEGNVNEENEHECQSNLFSISPASTSMIDRNMDNLETQI